MRVYVATTPESLKTLLSSGVLVVDDYLTPDQFQFDSETDLESREHLISLLAAEDSLEMNLGRLGLVLAVDLDSEQLELEDIPIRINQLAAVLYTEDGEELSYFAPDELPHQISSWL